MKPLRIPIDYVSSGDHVKLDMKWRTVRYFMQRTNYLTVHTEDGKRWNFPYGNLVSVVLCDDSVAGRLMEIAREL